MVRRLHEPVRSETTGSAIRKDHAATSEVPRIVVKAKHKKRLHAVKERRLPVPVNSLAKIEEASHVGNKYSREEGGISKTGLRNLGYAAGIDNMADDAHWAMLLRIKTMARQITKTAAICAEYRRRKTVCCSDVDLALTFLDKIAFH